MPALSGPVGSLPGARLRHTRLGRLPRRPRSAVAAPQSRPNGSMASGPLLNNSAAALVDEMSLLRESLPDEPVERDNADDSRMGIGGRYAPTATPVARDLVAPRRYRTRGADVAHLAVRATSNLRVVDRDADGSVIDVTMERTTRRDSSPTPVGSPEQPRG